MIYVKVTNVVLTATHSSELCKKECFVCHFSSMEEDAGVTETFLDKCLRLFARPGKTGCQGSV